LDSCGTWDMYGTPTEHTARWQTRHVLLSQEEACRRDKQGARQHPHTATHTTQRCNGRLRQSPTEQHGFLS
jgi:hypothetical protein